jgi:cobalt/nickel transport system permease protein
MHIEPGFLSPLKLASANCAASALVMTCALPLLRRPAASLVRTLVAAVFFTLCMQSVHVKVGPSEVHFIGAMPMYVLFGVGPTVAGFALGLLLQALLFEPADLLHLSVNTLSLTIPLLLVHAAFGRHLTRVDLQTTLRVDGTYYAGVTTMVGFWLVIGEPTTPLVDWVRFAVAYLPVATVEPLLTLAVLAAARQARALPGASLCLDLRYAH